MFFYVLLKGLDLPISLTMNSVVYIASRGNRKNTRLDVHGTDN